MQRGGDLFDFCEGIRIESGIPLTSDRSVRQRISWNPGEFPFDKLDVGQSFSVRPPAGIDLIYVQNKITGAASKLHRETLKRFTTRQQSDCVRCWRIA